MRRVGQGIILNPRAARSGSPDPSGSPPRAVLGLPAHRILSGSIESRDPRRLPGGDALHHILGTRGCLRPGRTREGGPAVGDVWAARSPLGLSSPAGAGSPTPSSRSPQNSFWKPRPPRSANEPGRPVSHRERATRIPSSW